MASPLILKIQAELERRGFDDVKRQIDRLKKAVTELGDDFEDTEKKSDGFLKGLLTFAAVTTVALVAVGIRQERVTAQIANSFEGLGLGADEAAAAIENLSVAMTRNAVVGRGELAQSLAILTRSTQSVVLAQQDSLIAQELALRNNISLEQASRALALAHAGEGRALAALVDLGARDIETLRERGLLREELARIVPLGEATGRELATISGAFENLTNRASAGFEQLGGVVLEQFNPAINLATNAVNIASFAFDGFLDNTIFKEQRAAEEAATLNERFEAISNSLNLVVGTGRVAFNDLQRAISQIDVTLQFFERDVRLLNSVENELVEGLKRERAELIETAQTRAELAQISFEDQVRLFEALNTSREDLRRRDLQQEIEKSEDILGREGLSNLEREKALLVLSNLRLRLFELERRAVAEGLSEELDFRRQLAALLQTPADVIDETSTIEERGRALDRALESRRNNLLLIEAEKNEELAIIDIELARKDLGDAEITRLENQKELIEANARASEIAARSAFLAQAIEIGELPGTPDLREREQRRLNTLLREQRTEERGIAEELRKRIAAKENLESIERNIATIEAEGGREELLERLLRRKEELQEIIGDAFIPTSEDAVDNLVEEIERKLDLPDININLNVDQLTLIEAIRAELTTILEAQGFSLNREATASSVVDEG
ncbi:hypothetical protein LCGC14_1640110 [marine sediment metagenome]|uniref:Uncharacterized protein n=1 Tax=marine sediment metagenome TaxID=412755 RepID=A0A0F9IMB6_9ZZZZ